MIVLNEREWAEERIAEKKLGHSPYETLSRVAKLYIEQGYTKKDTREKLEKFLVQCEPRASVVKWSGTLDNAVNRAIKTHSANFAEILITENELEVVNAIDGILLRRLAFTLLCLAKYHLALRPGTNGWVNTRDSEIMKLANINTSIRRQSELFRELNELGLIQFSKKIDNTNVRVLFVREGKVALHISDFRNLGHQYMYLTGHKEYMQCENCGLVIRNPSAVPLEMPQKAGRPRKYCSDCAIEVAVCNKINEVMRRNTANFM